MPLPKAPPSGFVPPCIPTRAAKPPAGPGWVHEIKHDGYRLQVRRDGDAVRMFTRRGYDWSARYPAIAGTAVQLRARSFTIDGEAEVCGPVHLAYSTSPGITIGSDLRSFIGSQLCVLPCMSVATTRYVSDPVG
jgi:hypothetical protein